MSGSNNFAPFCADKLSMETKKRTYLTVILPNCYSSEELQHQEALNPLIVQSNHLYIAWRQYSFNSQSTI